MRRVFEQSQDGRLQEVKDANDDRANAGLLVDLIDPDPAEVAGLPGFEGRLPTREDLHEIELSKRIYRSHGAEHMTILLVDPETKDEAGLSPVRLILTEHSLVVLRYTALPSFERKITLADSRTPQQLLVTLLDACVGAMADELEQLGTQMRAQTKAIYRDSDEPGLNDLRRALVFFGLAADQIATLRLSLASVDRVAGHVEQIAADTAGHATLEPALHRLNRDVQGVMEHANFLAARAAALADGTLGLLDVDQNRSVSMLSAVVSLFAPATLIASVYGMNFDWMPELHSAYGFVTILGGMVLSALITFLFFRWRGWM